MSCKACDGGSKMRMASSCNGCRALRKGCSEDCTIRPCLEWIATPEAQANSTVFLAKFYGRAGLLNLIAAAPAENRPAVFRSLVYEACGRIVNPVSGAVGLFWSGQWDKCAHAVEAMLRGELGVPVVVEAASEADDAVPPPPPLGARLGPSVAAYDIRHFDEGSASAAAAAAADLLSFARAGPGRKEGFKRAGSSSSSSSNANLVKGKGKARGIAKLLKGIAINNKRATSPSPPLGHDGGLMVMELLEHDGGRDKEFAGSHDHHLKLKGSKENTDVEAAASNVIQAEAEPPVGRQVMAADQEAEEEVGLELTLG